MTLGRCLVVGIVVTSLMGCGTAGPKAEPLVQASGTVKLNGRPAEGVRLIFHPTDTNKSLGGCWARTDSTGKYTVISLSNKEGIPPGPYQVTFSRFVRPDGTPLGPQESPTMTESTESVAKNWSNIGSSGPHNKAVIPEKGINNLDFNISSAPPKK